MQKKYPNMTREELMSLFDELGTWRNVAVHLDLPTQTLDGLKKRLDAGGNNKDRHKKPPSALDSLIHPIRNLASRGYTCPEIVDALDLPVQEEQVRRFLHKNGIPVQSRGGQRGTKNPSWKGGRTMSKGYVYLLRPDHPSANSNGYVREHRLVMEAHLGRYLTPTEVVHHKGSTTDNRIEQLALYESNGEHLRDTLKGKAPNWTEEGFDRMKAPRPQRKSRAASSNQPESESDDPS